MYFKRNLQFKISVVTTVLILCLFLTLGSFASVYWSGEFNKNILLALFGGVLFVVTFLIILLKQFIASLQALMDHLQSIFASKGQPFVCEVSGDDEIGQIGHAFDEILSHLEDRYQFLQNIMDSVPNPLFYEDVTGTYLGCNKTYLTFLGKTADQVIGKTVFDILSEEAAKLTFEHDQAILKSGSGLNYEVQVIRNDGQFRTALVTKALFLNRDGSIGGFVASFSDITDWQILDEQVRKLSTAVEQSPVSIIITDVKGRIEYVNPRFCLTTGYSREEAIGNNPRILKSGELSSGDYENLWQTILSGNEWRGEFHNQRKDGILFWEFASISPLKDQNGKVTGFIAVKEDISARKAFEKAFAQSQAELQNKHQQLESIFASVHEAKLEWEATLDRLDDVVILTDSSQCIKRCNRLLCELTGQDYEQMINKPWRSLLLSSGFVFINESDQRGELIHQPSRRLFDLNIFTMLDQENGQISGYVLSLNDTTKIRAVTEELKRTSLELIEAQQTVFQQEKMASIGQLAAGVAHEINNPMGFISSNLSTLEKYLERIREFVSNQDSLVASIGSKEDKNSLCELRKKLKIDYIFEDTQNLISESQDGAGRVRRIVQDLKSFSRVDQTEFSTIDINGCIESTINVAWNEIKYIATLNREFGDIPFVRCFPQQINQVFLNLLVNAAQAMKEQGTITVKTWNDDASVFISVADTGSGMPPDVMSRIFEPFYTTKDVGKGTGLGLSISYDIIKKHNGDIFVESVPGSGTTFTIRLPLNMDVNQDAIQ